MVAHPAGWHKVYFYPRPLRGGRPVSRRLPLRHKGISIHALCEEGDRGHQRGIQADFDFYPRPPRGGRPHVAMQAKLAKLFLSTPSARRATQDAQTISTAAIISIHALREEGDLRTLDSVRSLSISIHALREEGDDGSCGWMRRTQNFYPRPPRGGRQQKQRQNLYFQTNYTTFCTNLEEP